MARLSRVVVPGLPHHVTQRGNRREQVFFRDDDYQAYLDLVSAAAKQSGTQIWAYCLMPSHVHFIMVPSHELGLRQTFAEAHRRYTARINTRRRQTGHLWQGRFASTVMDERHLVAAARYVAMNPVRANLTRKAADWPWSSVAAHLERRDDGVVTTAPLLQRVGDFADFLAGEQDEAAVIALRHSYSTGRPIGAEAWLKDLEATTARALAPRKRGPKPKAAVEREVQLISKASP